MPSINQQHTIDLAIAGETRTPSMSSNSNGNARTQIPTTSTNTNTNPTYTHNPTQSQSQQTLSLTPQPTREPTLEKDNGNNDNNDNNVNSDDNSVKCTHDNIVGYQRSDVRMSWQDGINYCMLNYHSSIATINNQLQNTWAFNACHKEVLVWHSYFFCVSLFFLRFFLFCVSVCNMEPGNEM